MRFDSGRVSLDLVATRAGRVPVQEQLLTVERLAQWIRGVRIVPVDAEVAPGESWVPRFIELREVIGRMVTAELDGAGTDQGDVAALNEAARPAPPVLCALTGADGLLVRALSAPPSCEALLAVVARDAVELFTDPLDRSRLRRCAGEDCSLVYLDTSRGRRRRWCSSEVCGNRERVARHRRRTTVAAVQR